VSRGGQFQGSNPIKGDYSNSNRGPAKRHNLTVRIEHGRKNLSDLNIKKQPIMVLCWRASANEAAARVHIFKQYILPENYEYRPHAPAE